MKKTIEILVFLCFCLAQISVFGQQNKNDQNISFVSQESQNNCKIVGESIICNDCGKAMECTLRNQPVNGLYTYVYKCNNPNCKSQPRAAVKSHKQISAQTVEPRTPLEGTSFTFKWMKDDQGRSEPNNNIFSYKLFVTNHSEKTLVFRGGTVTTEIDGEVTTWNFGRNNQGALFMVGAHKTVVAWSGQVQKDLQLNRWKRNYKYIEVYYQNKQSPDLPNGPSPLSTQAIEKGVKQRMLNNNINKLNH